VLPNQIWDGATLDEDAQLDVPVEGVVRQVGAGDKGRVIHDGALGVQLARSAVGVSLPLFQRPVEDLRLVFNTAAEGLQGAS